MFVARRVPVDVIDLFMKISLHATAYGRVELGEVADFHWIADFRLPIADLFELKKSAREGSSFIGLSANRKSAIGN